MEFLECLWLSGLWGCVRTSKNSKLDDASTRFGLEIFESDVSAGFFWMALSAVDRLAECGCNMLRGCFRLAHWTR